MQEFEEIYQLYQKDVYYFLLKMTGYEDSLAEELTQESFYQAFCSFQKFRGECAMKTWLCQIAKNTYYRYVREQSKQKNLEKKAELEAEVKTVSDIVDDKLVVNHIRKVINDLDERSRRKE